MTPILKVITEYCAVYVDDINLQSLAEENMPLYARRMWGYLVPAMGLFTIPADMQLFLVGTPESPAIIEPNFSSFSYVVPKELTETTTFELGKEYIGFSLFCVREQKEDDFGNIYFTPTSIVSYVKETGSIVISATAENPVPCGTIFEMDFYTDGYFLNNLSMEIMNILGMCFQEVWQTRFMNDWLSNVSKIEDKSFNEQNRANKIKADTERYREIRIARVEAMRRFEQNLAYRKMSFGSNGFFGGVYGSTDSTVKPPDINSTYILASKGGRATQIPLSEFVDATKEIDIVDEINEDARDGLIQVVIDMTSN